MENQGNFRKIEIASLVLLFGFCFSVFFYYIQVFYLERQYPENTYLFRPVDQFPVTGPGPGIPGVHFFGDFFATWGQTMNGNPYRIGTIFYASNYFPFTHLLIKPFTFFSYQVALYLFWVANFLIFGLFIHCFLRVKSFAGHLYNVLVLGFLTYPFHMILDRGNVEGFVFLFLWLFVWAFQKERYYNAAVFLAAGAGMKLFPAVFGVLFLKKKKWGAAFASFLLFALFTVVSLVSFEGPLMETMSLLGDSFLAYSKNAERLGLLVLQHNSSLFAMFHGLRLQFPDSYLFGMFAESLAGEGYIWITGGVLIVVCFEILRRPVMELWECMALISTAFVILPQYSFDYRLVHLLLPLVLILADERPMTRKQWATLGLLIGICLPKGFYLIVADMSIGSVLNPLMGLVLLGLLLFRPWMDAISKHLGVRNPGVGR
ncbi:glycosyltransferase family 87 protein [Bdellovibrionota bacterium FG-2]